RFSPRTSISRMDKIRNIAIIAHVDHGKTTLVDQLLRQSGTFRSNQKIEERVMDSMDLEREKGITIRAKNAAFHWNDYRINIVDMLFDLFVELKATDEQLDLPIIYASAKEGFAMRELFATANPSDGGHENNKDMTPLFQAIVQHVPPPKISSEPFFQMLVSNL